MIIIGNKKDLEVQRRVSYEDAEDLAERLDAFHIETSAKEGLNVEEMFMEIAKSCYENALKIENNEI